MFSSRESSTVRSLTSLPDVDDDEKTTAVSVNTLRDLVSRTVEESAPLPRGRTAPQREPSSTRRISPSKPAFLEKKGAILVLAEASARMPKPLEASPVIESAVVPSAASDPPAVHDAAPFAEPLPPIAVPLPALPPQPTQGITRPAPEVEAPAFPAPLVRTSRHREIARSPRKGQRVALWQVLRCRLVALVLLAFAIYARPWWWDVGDLHVREAPRAPEGAAQVGR